MVVESGRCLRASSSRKASREIGGPFCCAVSRIVVIY
nr:MAG TPA: hypothetical protein [Caudoviricetes sp.]